MGNKSSKYVKKYEHHLQLEAVQRTLVELQHEVRQQKDEVAEKNKRNKTEIKTLKDLHEKQKSCFLASEREVQLLKKDISRLKELDELKHTLRKLNNEHLDDRTKIHNKIKQVIEKERQAWENDVFELRERYETMKKYSMELISSDLSHEREIKELQNRIRFIENKYAYSTKKDDVSQRPSHNSTNRSRSISPNDSFSGNEASNSYELKFSKINMAMKKLKEDIKIAEIKKCNSQF